jgi:hypothetical protein
MKRSNLFKRLIEKYKEYRKKNFIDDFLERRKKKIQIRTIFKRNDFSITFYRTFSDSLLSGI